MNRLQQHQQQGLSMIELLVALAISSFLILGITQVYIDNKRNYVFQQGQAGNLDNSRFAVLMLDEVLSKAGYRRAPDQGMEDAFPAESNPPVSLCEGFAQEAVVTNLKNDATGFCVRYQLAQEGELLCDGNAAALNNDFPFIYPGQDELAYLAIQFTPGDDELHQGTISCHTSDASVELLIGIADMQVEFASGPDVEKRLKNNPYKNATDWEATDGIVRAIRYSVLSASRPNLRDGDSLVFSKWQAKTATDTAKDRLAAGDNRNIYQAAVGSQALRNMMP